MTVWNGLYTDGEIIARNGRPFIEPAEGERDCRNIVQKGDVLSYATGRQFRIIYVDSDLVKMEGPL